MRTRNIWPHDSLWHHGKITFHHHNDGISIL